MRRIRNTLAGAVFASVRLAVTLLGALACVFAGTAFGEEGPARKKVRVACAAFERLMELDKDFNPVSGYAYEYIQTIALYAGWNVEYVHCEGFADCIDKLLSGEADLSYDVSYTEERAKRILYPSEPMGIEYYFLYTSKDNTSILAGDYASMNGKSVGVTLGTMPTDMLKEWCAKKKVDLKFVAYKDIPDKERALSAGAIDLDLEISLLAKHNLSAIEKIGSSSYYLVANKSRPDLVEDINSAMDKVLINDLNYFVRIQDRYFSDTVLSRNLTVDEKNWVATHNRIRIGYMDNYLPFSSRDKNGNPIGAGIEATREMLKKLNLANDIAVEYTCFNNQRDGYKAVESGEVDMMFPSYISNSVKNDFRIIGGKEIASIASDLAFLENCKDGKGIRIGVNGNNLMQHYYTKDTYPHSSIVEYDDIRSCLDGVLDGTADGTIINAFRTETLLKPIKYRHMRTIRCGRGFDLRMAFAADNIGLMLLMDRGLTLINRDFISDASYSYMGRMNIYTLMDFLREHVLLTTSTVAVLAALVMALLVYWVNNRRLAQLNREAKAANRAKTVFLNNMSHDKIGRAHV